MSDTPTWDALYGQAMEDAPKLAKPPLAPALGSVVIQYPRRAKVTGTFITRTGVPRFFESGWMPEQEALAYASGCRANGRYTQIEVVTKRKRNGHWEIEGRLPYPPNK